MSRSLALILAFASIVTAADVSGTWSGIIMGSATETARIYLTIKQDRQKISGMIAYGDESKPVPVEAPALKGDVLFFEVHDNPKRIVRFSLTLSGDILKGEATSGDQVMPVNLSRRYAILLRRYDYHAQ